MLLSMILLITFSCDKDTDPSEPQEIQGLKTLTVNIQLPTGSNISANDLKVSSLFSENVQVTNNNAEIESFDDHSMELTFATNSQGNIVLLSYFNPMDGDFIEMNTESTAIAVVMLHPWSFDLSDNAKAEAITYIKNLPEFQTYKSAIENSISSGELNPLNTQSVLEKVTEIQQTIFDRITQFTEPLEFNIQNSTASVKNSISSASYSVGLYDENNVLIEHKLAEGLDKSHFFFQEFKDYIFQGTENTGQTATFNIPTDGYWTLKAKSGLSFDGSLENQQAAYYNTKTVVANVLGIFSSKLKSLIKNGECFIALGENVYNGVSGSVVISSSLQSYSNGTITGYILTKDVLSYTLDRFDSVLSIIENCSTDGTELNELDKIKSSFFGKILGFLNVVSRLENVFNTTAMLTDWIQFDKEIEYCFIKNGNEINTCLPDPGIVSFWDGTYSVDGGFSFTITNGSISDMSSPQAQTYPILEALQNEDYTVELLPNSVHINNTIMKASFYDFDMNNFMRGILIHFRYEIAIDTKVAYAVLLQENDLGPVFQWTENEGFTYFP